MATLKAIKYAKGYDRVGSWFNKSNPGKSNLSRSYFDTSEWGKFASTYSQNTLVEHHDKNGNGTVSPKEASALWKLSKSQISYMAKATYKFFDGDELVRTKVYKLKAVWKGQFRVKGDRITGGYVKSFERSWATQGKIKVSDFKYSVKKEADSFARLTLPKKITKKINENLDFLGEGEKYTFKTKYDRPNDSKTRRNYFVEKPKKFNRKSARIIQNFDLPKAKLNIDTNTFGIEGAASFKKAKDKNKLKKLARKDFDFIYDQKKGGLYFNENGAKNGFGKGGIIAILEGSPKLTSSHLNFL